MTEINEGNVTPAPEQDPRGNLIRKELHLPDGHIVELFKNTDNPKEVLTYTVRTPEGEVISQEELFTSAAAYFKRC